MSVNLSQLLSEARTLVTRLHDRDKVTEGLLNQTSSLNDKIKCMKEYKEDVSDFTHDASNRAAGGQSRNKVDQPTKIVHNVQQENRQIQLLQIENRNLKISLEEHQTTLDLIMQRYRRQVCRMMTMQKLDGLSERASQLTENTNSIEDFERMVEFARVVDKCLKVGEQKSSIDQEEMSQLQTENQTLRNLLKVAAQNDAAAARAFVELLAERRESDGNDTPKSCDDQHTPTSETVDLDISHHSSMSNLNRSTSSPHRDSSYRESPFFSDDSCDSQDETHFSSNTVKRNPKIPR